MIYLSISNLKKEIEGEELLREINYDFGKKQLCWIQGENGQGKTLLCNTLAHIVTPDDGKVEWSFRIQKNVSIIFDVHALVSNLSISQNLALILEHFQIHLESKHKSDYINKLLNEWGLEKFKDLRPVSLSRSQSMKVSLIRALLPSPKVLLWDDALECFEGEEQHFILQKLEEEQQKGTQFLFFSRKKCFLNNIPKEELVLNKGQLK